jgi:hypothetical protein
VPPEAVIVPLYAAPTVAPGRVEVVIASWLSELVFEFTVKEPHPVRKTANPTTEAHVRSCMVSRSNI